MTSVTLLTIWAEAQRQSADILTRDGIFLTSEVDYVAIAAEGADLLSPRGKVVGVTEGDDDRAPKPPLTEEEEAEADTASAVEEQLPPPPDAQALCQPCRRIELPERGGCVSAATAVRMAMDGTSLTS